jgi:hypothetical protein
MNTIFNNTPEPVNTIPNTQYYYNLISRLRSCKKNKSIGLYLKFCSGITASQLKTLQINAMKTLKKPEINEILDSSGLFMWFIVKKRKMRDLIPDIEFLKYREICFEMISVIGNCCEAHFGLCKMYAHEANFDTALQHIRIALSDNKNDKIYNLWNAILTVFRVNSKKRALQAKKICNGKGLNSFGQECTFFYRSLLGANGISAN